MSGIRVELDGSGCIVLRQRRLNGPDIVLTVTNVERLREDLADALMIRDIADQVARGSSNEQ